MNVVRRLAEPFYVASTTCCVALKAAPYVSSGALGLNVCPYMVAVALFLKCIHSTDMEVGLWVMKTIQRCVLKLFFAGQVTLLFNLLLFLIKY